MSVESPPFSVVIPVLNEVDSLPKLFAELEALASSDPTLSLREVILVDDGSTDGTIDLAAHWAGSRHPFNPRVIRRTTRLGPASAELEGIQAAASDLVVKLDADGQHPVGLIPALVRQAIHGTEVVIASRYMSQGVTNWSPIRGLISRVALWASRLALKAVRGVRDPISGYFAVRKELTIGLDTTVPRYKLLLYVLVSNPNVHVKEIPFVMTDRKSGSSKIVGTSLRYIAAFVGELGRYRKVSARLASRRGSPGRAPDLVD